MPAQQVSLPADLYSDGVTKLIKTANYRFEVDDVKKSLEAIEAAVHKHQAYVSSSDMRLDHPILENKMTIRVRSEFFQDLLKEIDQQARYVHFRDVKTEDVSKQFVDLESRLKTKREVEARYIEILRKKAGTIEELLNAERQIGHLQEEIEATISRINHLKDEVRYSTVKLDFYQRVSQVVASASESTNSERISKALVSGWEGLVAVVVGALYLWPLIVVLLTGLTVYHFTKRRTRLV